MSTATVPVTATTSSALRVGASVAVISAIANVAIWSAATLGGVPFDVTPAGASTQHVNVATVVLMTLGPLVLGAFALAVTRRSAKAWRFLAWVGLAIGVLTVVMPFSTTATDGTHYALAAMHLVVGATWFALVSRALREG